MALIPALSAASAAPPRLYGGFYTKERVADVRRNCTRYDWAAQRRDKTTSAAKAFVKMTDEELWRMVPGQDLPRCIDITLDTLTTGPRRLGCLKCGKDWFNFADYLADRTFDAKPWKIVCGKCGAVFPTNDFPRYYKSAIDERGLFNPAKGDRSLLFNAEHPDPKDPLHKFGVDDGFGFIDENGRSHKFVAVYAFRYWRYIVSAARTLAEAYMYTGERVYAHKAAALLDRIADVYPDMDWNPYAERGWYHSDGSSKRGRIEGRIWECGVMAGIAQAYEQVLPGTDGDSELYGFLEEMGRRYKLPSRKGTRELFVGNCDDRILRCTAKAVQDGQVYGNEGMHQWLMVTLAMAINTQPETDRWLDWVFNPTEGALPAFIVEQMDRDGVGPEAAPHYALMWGEHFARIADRIADYGLYTKHDIHRDFPQFRACLTAPWHLAVLGVATPNIGDTGATGMISRPCLFPQPMARAFRDTGDAGMAVCAYRANNNSARGLGQDVFAADPAGIEERIGEIGRAAGPRPEGGTNLGGFGLATLESGTGLKGNAVACNYGRTSMHGHMDQLNFDLLACGAWLMPDLGNPEFKTNYPSRNAWTINTVSHNTVVVDGLPQERNHGGRGRFHKQLAGFGAFEIECPRAYPATKRYARTMLQIAGPDGQAYVADFFRVEGGNDHLLSLHGPPGAVEAEGLKLDPQTSGTYAGPDVPFGAEANGFPLGYSYLYNVRRDARPSAAFHVDWAAEAGYRGLKADDNVHLRLHAFTPCADVALADGDPAQNQPGNPRRLGYVLMHRAGSGLATSFVSLLEPYRGKPFIRKAVRLGEAADDTSRALLRVELADGSVDTIFWCGERGTMTMEERDGIPAMSFAGKVGFVRTKGGKVVRAVLVEGSELRCAQMRLEAKPVFSGKVVRMNRELGGGGWIWLDGGLPDDGSIVGQEVVIANDGTRNACYRIRKAERDGKLMKVDCGPITFVKGYKGPKIEVRNIMVAGDYTQGYEYDFEEGARFEIPNHAFFAK